MRIEEGLGRKDPTQEFDYAITGEEGAVSESKKRTGEGGAHSEVVAQGGNGAQNGRNGEERDVDAAAELVGFGDGKKKVSAGEIRGEGEVGQQKRTRAQSGRGRAGEFGRPKQPKEGGRDSGPQHKGIAGQEETA